MRKVVWTLDAKTAWGQLSKAAVIWAVWLQSSSIAYSQRKKNVTWYSRHFHDISHRITCFPRMTKSAFSSAASLARILEMCKGWRLSYSAPLHSMWIPRSAPIASAVRKVSCERRIRYQVSILKYYVRYSYLTLSRSTWYSHNFFGYFLLLHTDSFFDGYFIKRIHWMLDSFGNNTQLVGFNTNLEPLNRSVIKTAKDM